MPRRIRTLIVDDEPIARRTLHLLLAGDPDIELVGECEAPPSVWREAGWRSCSGG